MPISLQDIRLLREVLERDPEPFNYEMFVADLEERAMPYDEDGNRITPCTEKGYNVGDQFVLTAASSPFLMGEVVTLIHDDQDYMPRFENKRGSSYVHLKDVTPMPEGYVPPTWREFMLKRFDEGEYKVLPTPVLELMEKFGFTEDPDHFLHQGLDDKLKIAYTENEERGERDRQTVTTLGRYLRKFSDLDDPKVAAISNLYRTQQIGNIEMKIATTREEIDYVYSNGPDSCMSRYVDAYDTDGVRPTEIYATPDCGVAYIERKHNGSTRVTARTVLNSIKKTYIRIYGDDQTLRSVLEDQGYKQGDLEGCSLLLLRNNRGEVIAPYIDGNVRTVEVMNDHLLVTEDGSYIAESESGLLDPDEGVECGWCGEQMSRHDDTWYSEYHDVSFGECCRDNFEWTYVSGNIHDWIAVDRVEIYEYNGEYYLEDVLGEHDLILIDDEVHSIDDTVWSDLDSEHYLRADAEPYLTVHGDTDYTVECADELVQVEGEDLPMLEDEVHRVEIDNSTVLYFRELPEELNVA